MKILSWTACLHLFWCTCFFLPNAMAYLPVSRTKTCSCQRLATLAATMASFPSSVEQQQQQYLFDLRNQAVAAAAEKSRWGPAEVVRATKMTTLASHQRKQQQPIETMATAHDGSQHDESAESSLLFQLRNRLVAEAGANSRWGASEVERATGMNAEMAVSTSTPSTTISKMASAKVTSPSFEVESNLSLAEEESKSTWGSKEVEKATRTHANVATKQAAAKLSVPPIALETVFGDWSTLFVLRNQWVSAAGSKSRWGPKEVKRAAMAVAMSKDADHDMASKDMEEELSSASQTTAREKVSAMGIEEDTTTDTAQMTSKSPVIDMSLNDKLATMYVWEAMDQLFTKNEWNVVEDIFKVGNDQEDILNVSFNEVELAIIKEIISGREQSKSTQKMATETKETRHSSKTLKAEIKPSVKGEGKASETSMPASVDALLRMKLEELQWECNRRGLATSSKDSKASLLQTLGVPVKQWESWSTMTISELKEVLRTKGLKVGGKKSDLLQRLGVPIEFGETLLEKKSQRKTKIPKQKKESAKKPKSNAFAKLGIVAEAERASRTKVTEEEKPLAAQKAASVADAIEEEKPIVTEKAKGEEEKRLAAEKARLEEQRLRAEKAKAAAAEKAAAAKAEEEKRIAAEKVKAEQENRLAAEKAAAAAKAAEEKRIAAEKAAAAKAEEEKRIAAENAKAEEEKRLAAEKAAAEAEKEKRIAAETAAEAKADQKKRLAADNVAVAKAEERRVAAEKAAKEATDEKERIAFKATTSLSKVDERKRQRTVDEAKTAAEKPAVSADAKKKEEEKVLQSATILFPYSPGFASSAPSDKLRKTVTSVSQAKHTSFSQKLAPASKPVVPKPDDASLWSSPFGSSPAQSPKTAQARDHPFSESRRSDSNASLPVDAGAPKHSLSRNIQPTNDDSSAPDRKPLEKSSPSKSADTKAASVSPKSINTNVALSATGSDWWTSPYGTSLSRVSPRASRTTSSRREPSAAAMTSSTDADKNAFALRRKAFLESTRNPTATEGNYYATNKNSTSGGSDLKRKIDL